MSFDPHHEGTFAADRGAPVEASPQWPVLARLPLVGPRMASPSAPLPTYAALEPPSSDLAAQRPAPPLRIVDPLPGQTTVELPSAPHGLRLDPPQHRGQGSIIEPPSPPRRQQYRIDSAEDRFRGSHAARRPADDSMPALVARWHAAAAPYAGVAVTAALIVTASLLYWLTVGRPQASFNGDELFDSQNSWSSETPSAPPMSAIDRPEERPLAVLASPSPSAAVEAPRVADAAAVASEPLPEATASTPVESTKPSDGPAMSSGAEPSAPATEPAPPVAAAPITPTPHTLPYPTTDYPWFEFGLPGAAPEAPPATASSAAAANSASEERPQ